MSGLNFKPDLLAQVLAAAEPEQLELAERTSDAAVEDGVRQVG